MSGKLKYSHLLTKGLMFYFGVCCQLTVNAKEGMWIPATLKAHEKDMRSMGLSIPVDMLYNENGTGMNNAVVLFGKGCTGEVISPQGLVLTNHHCGYGSVQGLSSAASLVTACAMIFPNWAQGFKKHANQLPRFDHRQLYRQQFRGMGQ